VVKNPRLKKRESSALREVLVRKVMRNLLISHSRKEPQNSLKSKTFISKKRVKKPSKRRQKKKKLKLLQELLVVLKAKRRLPQNLQQKQQRPQERNQLKKNQLQRVLKRFLNTLQANQLERKKLLKKVKPQLSKKLLPQRNKLQLCHHQVERNQPRQLIK
jgi:hypothetical protein